jgi:hypothetical protein
MRVNTAAAVRPREPSFVDDGVRVEGGVRLYYLPADDVYWPAERFMERSAEVLRDYAERDRRARLRRPSERYRELEARRLLVAEELAG